MFRLMGKIREKEKKDGKKVAYSVQDILDLFNIDAKRKYEIEKSSCYIGYKLLWIIRQFLAGRQVPYGSLSDEKKVAYVKEIGSFIQSGSGDFVREFLEFDP